MNSDIYSYRGTGGLCMKKWDGSSFTIQVHCSIMHRGAGVMVLDGFGRADLILITSMSTNSLNGCAGRVA